MEDAKDGYNFKQEFKILKTEKKDDDEMENGNLDFILYYLYGLAIQDLHKYCNTVLRENKYYLIIK